MSESIPYKLCISLLGPPTVSLAGEVYSIPRRQVRALLYRLAAEPRPLSRSYLCFLFWGDLPESIARKNLSRLLVYLSRALPNQNLLRSDETQLQLDARLAWVDTRAFDQHWEMWKSTRQLQELQSAVEFYRGSFLNGFALPGGGEYNSWLDEQAWYWEQNYLKALAILIAETTEQGEFSAGIECARRYLACNSLAEDIHRRLIELYAASGDRSAALRQYELCATILERELGVRPAPETQAAYQAVLDLKLLAMKPLPELQPAWTIWPSLQLPFVGRQESLQALESALAHTRDGRGEVVFIHGEPGIGKSRLMQEFTGRPRLRTRLLLASAQRESYTLPYQPLVEAIRPALSVPGILTHVPRIWIAEAARLFPELTDFSLQPQPPTPLSADEARARLFEALYHILVGFTQGGYTLLLCLDDLQWADVATLDWLVYLGRHISRQRILVIGSYRREDDKNLTNLRQSLARQVNFSDIPLEGLVSEDACRLVKHALPLDKSQADRLCLATGGNPFFLLETLRVMLESRPAPEEQFDSEHFPLPATVQAAVNARLEHLHPQVRQILEAASILGFAFSLDALHLTSGRQEMEILDGLDELVARQFLFEEPTGYQFCHAITREAVYASLGYWRRRKLHQRAGQSLEKLNSDDWTALSWHFEQAGELIKAAEYALRAGQAAKSVFAHAQARTDFERALALLELEAGDWNDADVLEASQRMRIRALYERGWVLRLLGEMDAYTRDLQEVADLAQALGDPRLLADLRWREAYNHRWFCRYEAARCAAVEGLRLSQEIADPSLEALCQRELGMAARETGDCALAQSALERALDLFTHQTSEIVYTIHTLGNLSTLFCRLGEPERAMDLARRALEICERSGLPYERRLPLGDMGVAAIALGETGRARDFLLDSLSIARQVADRTQEIICQGHLGWIEIGQGDYTAARQFLKSALDLAGQIGSLTEQSWLHAGLAEAHSGLGERELALAYARLALEIAQTLARIPDQRRAQDILSRLEAPSFPLCE
ncbi:MAG: AAA family ATPase [Anaerolineales bacterium]|nr:AAA family ATPase [Anaerolineales bacterium]